MIPALKSGTPGRKKAKKYYADQPSRFPKMNIEQFMDAGIAFATVNYGRY
jgi:hypothetical protein